MAIHGSMEMPMSLIMLELRTMQGFSAGLESAVVLRSLIMLRSMAMSWSRVTPESEKICIEKS